MARRSYRGNSLATTVSVGITSSSTSLTLTDGSSFPTGTSPFVVTLDFGQAGEEKILATTRSGNILTGLTRGYDGTTATAHSAGATARHTLSATDLDEANAHVNATSAVHGVAGALVGTTDVQTLTNKTLTQPIVGDFTNATHTHTDVPSGGVISIPPSFDPKTKYALLLNPPTATTVTVTSSGTNTNQSNNVAFGYSLGATSGNYVFAGRSLTDGNGLASYIRTANIDVTARISLPSLGVAAADIYLGVCDGGASPNSSVKGAWILIDGTGVVKTLKRVASTPTSGTTTAAAATAGPYRDYRIVYPFAGGTATVYVDGVQVGTIASVPSQAINASVGVGVETASANGLLFACAQFYLTEG
jgi:hypothetical protein